MPSTSGLEAETRQAALRAANREAYTVAVTQLQNKTTTDNLSATQAIALLQKSIASTAPTFNHGTIGISQAQLIMGGEINAGFSVDITNQIKARTDIVAPIDQQIKNTTQTDVTKIIANYDKNTNYDLAPTNVDNRQPKIIPPQRIINGFTSR